MMNRFRVRLSTLSASAIIFWLIFMIIAVIGWVKNIIDLIHVDSVLTGEGAVRIAGIFILPLGVILGWFF